MSITKEEIKKLHAMAAKSGLIYGSNRTDLLALVHLISGKEHVSELTESEYQKVITRIKNTPGGGQMSKSKIKKAWFLMYQLCKADKRDDATPKQRMIGAIKAILKVDVPRSGDIFAWVTERQGDQIIEQLKRFLKTAQKKAGDKCG